MKNLSSSQRSYLRSLAHHLEPVMFIGKNGLTDGAIETVNNALTSRELIKIKFREFKDEKQSLSHRLSELTGSHLVGMIGHTIILFRKNHDSDKQKIRLPEKNNNN